MEVAQKVHLWRAEDGLTLRLYAGPTAIHAISPNSQFCISGAGDQRYSTHFPVLYISYFQVLKRYQYSNNTKSHLNKIAFSLVTLCINEAEFKWQIKHQTKFAKKVWYLRIHSPISRAILMSTHDIIFYEDPYKPLCVKINEKNDFILLYRLQIWSLTNGSIIKEVSHTDKITCLTCSDNNQYLVTGSVDRSMKVWELATGKIVQVIYICRFVVSFL